MAKQRKVGNLLALAVLATLVERPMHPYEIASLLRSRGKEDDMDIKWGSFYTVVRNLVKHGFIEVVDTTRAGARPERTVYRITGAGRAELVDWVRELVATPQPEQPKFKAGLSVLAVLTPDEAITLLGQRVAALDQAIATLRQLLTEHAEIPRLFMVEDEYELALLDAEAAWVRALIAELESGSFADLAAWRAAHAALTLAAQGEGSTTANDEEH
jgi:DNA-binding PadR family transcriptional regulator